MKTKKVKIAVVIDNTGFWWAKGFSDRSGNPNQDVALNDCLNRTFGTCNNVYWIEADLEIPEQKTITGAVNKCE